MKYCAAVFVVFVSYSDRFISKMTLLILLKTFYFHSSNFYLNFFMLWLKLQLKRLIIYFTRYLTQLQRKNDLFHIVYEKWNSKKERTRIWCGKAIHKDITPVNVVLPEQNVRLSKCFQQFSNSFHWKSFLITKCKCSRQK